MKKLFIFLFVMNLSCVGFTQIQEVPLRDEIFKSAFDAIGFYEGTVFSLDTIAELSPASKIKCNLAKLHFQSAFKESSSNLYSFLYLAIGKSEVEEIIKGGLAESKKMFEGAELDRALVDSYIMEVEGYAKGKIPQPTLETLLYFKYINAPAKEILDGFYEYYSTKGHSKSTGLEIKFKIPITFKYEEGQRPHVVQRFSEFEGRFGGLAVLTIIEIPKSEGVFDASTNPSLINESDIVKYCVDEGAKLRHFEVIEIDGVPFAAVESQLKKTLATGILDAITLSYTTIYKNRVIVLSFNTQVKSESEVHYEHNKLLYKTIASSMVFMDQWKRK